MKWCRIGYENVIRYIHNYNVKKFNRPFAYFSRIIWFAFYRKIESEKNRLEQKIKYEERFNIFDVDPYDQYQAGDGHKEYIKEFLRKREETRARKNGKQNSNTSDSRKLAEGNEKPKIKRIRKKSVSRQTRTDSKRTLKKN